MKTAMILALMLVLTASTAYAMNGAGSVVVDIVGSTTDNTRVVSGGGPIVLEFVGSTSTNTNISFPMFKVRNEVRCCDFCGYPDVTCNKKTEDKQVKYPWESMHLGVDAWYGTFWYTDVNMPKWPQI